MSLKNNQWRELVIFSTILIVGVIAIYLQTGSFEYLRVDDGIYTRGCPFVATGFSLENIKGAFSNFCWGGIWMPVTSITYMIGVSLFGQGSGAHHLLNVLFHAINAVLFFILLLRLANKLDKDESGNQSVPLLTCFAAAALWAWHPLRVESVAWIASRKDAVFTLFTLIGLLNWPQRRVIAYFCMALSCMSKPTAMCFPFLAIAVDWLDGHELPRNKRQWRCAATAYAPLFILAFATGALAPYSQMHSDGDELMMYYGTFGWRMENAFVSLGLQLWHMLVPVNLNYWYRPVDSGHPVGALLGLSILTVSTVAILVWFTLKKNDRGKILRTGLWFMAAIGPTLGIAASFGRQAYADRFTYLPMMAFSILLVWSMPRKRILSAILIAIAAGYGYASYSYTKCFKDDFAAVGRVISCDEGHDEALAIFGGMQLVSTRDPNKAMPYFRMALKANPNSRARGDLVFALSQRNQPGDREEIMTLTEKVRDNPESDVQGMMLEVLIGLAMEKGDQQSVVRYLIAQTKCEVPQMAAKAAAALQQLLPKNPAK